MPETTSLAALLAQSEGFTPTDAVQARGTLRPEILARLLMISRAMNSSRSTK